MKNPGGVFGFSLIFWFFCIKKKEEEKGTTLEKISLNSKSVGAQAAPAKVPLPLLLSKLVKFY